MPSVPPAGRPSGAIDDQSTTRQLDKSFLCNSLYRFRADAEGTSQLPVNGTCVARLPVGGGGLLMAGQRSPAPSLPAVPVRSPTAGQPGPLKPPGRPFPGRRPAPLARHVPGHWGRPAVSRSPASPLLTRPGRRPDNPSPVNYPSTRPSSHFSTVCADSRPSRPAVRQLRAGRDNRRQSTTRQLDQVPIFQQFARIPGRRSPLSVNYRRPRKRRPSAERTSAASGPRARRTA